MQEKIIAIIEQILENNYINPYSTIQEELFERINEIELVSCSRVLLTGTIENFYVYLEMKDNIWVYNKDNDLENCFLLQRIFLENIREVKFSNKIILLEKKDIFLKEIFNMPKIVLINLCVLENFPIPRFNLGTGVIASYVRQYQYAEVYILDMQVRISMQDIINTINMLNPDIIGLSISFGQKWLAADIIENLNEHCKAVVENAIISLGNVIPSLYTESILEEFPNVIISYQEGEETMLDLIDFKKGKKKLVEVQGIAYLNNGRYAKNKGKLMEMKNVPFPAIDTLRDVVKYRGALTLETSRSCNYAVCTFCPRVHKGTKWRGYESNEIIEKLVILDKVIKKLDIPKFLYIADEEFIGQLPHNEERERIFELCAGIKQNNIELKFDTSARIDSIYNPKDTDEVNIERLKMWYSLKESGLNRLFIGVESGDDNQLKRFAKGTTAEQNKIGLQLITALGVNVRFGYITFDPLMEDFSDIIISHEFVERNDVLIAPVDMTQKTFEQLYYDVINDNTFVEDNKQNIPLYEKISYPLTSLEVLFASRYAKIMKTKETELDSPLLRELDMNMARYKSDYLNPKIGLVSLYCQKWIDYNFPVNYTLKGLYKNAIGESREKIYSLMTEAKSVDHFLLSFLLKNLKEKNDDMLLTPFLKDVELIRITDEEDTETIIINSLNVWQKLMAKVVNKIEHYINAGIIIDTNDSKMMQSISDWKKSRGRWENIN